VSALHVERTTVNDLVISHLRDDDLSNVAQLECALRETCGATPDAGRVVVDATGVDFLSVAGVTALVRGQQRCRGRGLDFSVVAAHRAVLRPLQATGVGEQVAICASLEAATENRSLCRWRPAAPGFAALAIARCWLGGDPLRPASPRWRSPLVEAVAD
jgi:anti-anti-sigma factor